MITLQGNEKNMKTRIRATDITDKVRKAVKARDNYSCIFCDMFGDSGYDATQIMHYVGRAKNGLGIEQNLAFGCVAHHAELDNGKDSKKYREAFAEYLKGIYPDWDERDLVYNKWSGFAIGGNHNG